MDSVYFQQNSFDLVDAAVGPERQRHVFSFLLSVLKTTFHFSTKDEARSSFNRLRQKILDWNSSQWNSDDFTRIEKELSQSLVEKAKDGR